MRILIRCGMSRRPFDSTVYSPLNERNSSNFFGLTQRLFLDVVVVGGCNEFKFFALKTKRKIFPNGEMCRSERSVRNCCEQSFAQRGEHAQLDTDSSCECNLVQLGSSPRKRGLPFCVCSGSKVLLPVLSLPTSGRTHTISFFEKEKSKKI